MAQVQDASFSSGDEVRAGLSQSSRCCPPLLAPLCHCMHACMLPYLCCVVIHWCSAEYLRNVSGSAVSVQLCMLPSSEMYPRLKDYFIQLIINCSDFVGVGCGCIEVKGYIGRVPLYVGLPLLGF